MPEPAPAPSPEQSCPRCGFANVPGSAECGRCGVILSRARHLPVRAPIARRPGRRFTGVDLALLLALAAAAAWVALTRFGVPGERSSAPATLAAAPAVAAADRPVDDAAVADLLAAAAAPPEAAPAPGEAADAVADAAEASEGMSVEDRATLERLGRLSQRGAVVETADVFAAEDLYRRHPDVPAIGDLARSVLRAAADGERRQGRTGEALRLLQRMADLWPESAGTWQQLVLGHLNAGQWSEAETAARRALSEHPQEAVFHQLQAVALIRQNRHEEAAEALRRALALGEDPGVRATLERIESELAHERSMARRGSLHFTVQLQAGASEGRAREALELLERKYSELARTLDFEPRQEIPVLLYPTGEGMEASGGPAWAAGTYSHTDGRIRISTADLSAGITPDLEETLAHELVHAFVAGRAGGNVPRAINEGLAQYLSGRRPRPVVINAGALAGRGGSVHDFYEAALSFVEFLIRRYGQGAMNDLLAGLGKGDLDSAAKRAYGSGYDGLMQEWVKQLR